MYCVITKIGNALGCTYGPFETKREADRCVAMLKLNDTRYHECESSRVKYEAHFMLEAHDLELELADAGLALDATN